MGNRQCLRLLFGKLTAMSFVNPVNMSLCLETVCASNYQKLFRLIPDLLEFKEAAVGASASQAYLHLRVIDHSAYTMTVELSHCFKKNLDGFLEPAVIIRIYLDAQLAEVLSDHARASVAKVFQDPGLSLEIMHYKWRLNYFLQKWLDHCLTKDYQFLPDPTKPPLLA